MVGRMWRLCGGKGLGGAQHAARAPLAVNQREGGSRDTHQILDTYDDHTTLRASDNTLLKPPP
jgi:hypothetical protein